MSNLDQIYHDKCESNRREAERQMERERIFTAVIVVVLILLAAAMVTLYGSIITIAIKQAH